MGDPANGRPIHCRVRPAGHLPPLLRGPGGETGYVEGGGGLMGLEDAVYSDLERPLPSGASLILYTDGVVERRGESLDVGLERLARAAASGPDSPHQLCDHVLAELLPEPQQHDDVTAVIVKVL